MPLCRAGKYGRAMAQRGFALRSCASVCFGCLHQASCLPMGISAFALCNAGIQPVKLCARMLVMPGRHQISTGLKDNGCWWHADVHYVQPGLPPVHPRTPTSAGRQHSTEERGSFLSQLQRLWAHAHAGHRFSSSSSNKVTCLSCVLGLAQDPPACSTSDTCIWDTS